LDRNLFQEPSFLCPFQVRGVIVRVDVCIWSKPCLPCFAYRLPFAICDRVECKQGRKIFRPYERSAITAVLSTNQYCECVRTACMYCLEILLNVNVPSRAVTHARFFIVLAPVPNSDPVAGLPK